MNVVIPVPRDRNGRMTLSDAQWSSRLDRATFEAVKDQGGFTTWRFDRVTGQDEKGNVVVRLLRREPERTTPIEHRPSSERPGAAEAARAEAARREAQRQQTRAQRGEQGRDR